MIFTEVGESIEGKKIALQCRKLYPLRPYKEERLRGKTVFPIKLGRFGRAIIETPLTFNSKEDLVCKNSHVNKGDEIRGETLKVFSIKPIPDKKVKPATAKHKGHFSYTKDHTYAEIEISSRHSAEKKK